MENRRQRIAKMQQMYKEREESYKILEIQPPGTKEVVRVRHGGLGQKCKLCMEDYNDGYQIRIWSLVRAEMAITIDLCENCIDEFSMAFPFGDISMI